MIYLQNPDRLWYKKNISSFLKRNSGMKKYEYILDCLLSKEVVNVILPVYMKYDFFYTFIRKFKFYIWCKINNLDFSKFNIVYKYNKLTVNDQVFLFYSDNVSRIPIYNEREKYLKEFRDAVCSFVLHFSHFSYNIETGLSNLNFIVKKKTFKYVFENDLLKSKLFHEKFLPILSGCNNYILPFSVEQRFSNLNLFRPNFGLASGAIPFPVFDKFLYDTYQSSDLQYQRRYILDNFPDVYKNYLHVNFSVYKEPNNSHSLFSNLIFCLKNLFIKPSSDSYYSIDIVKLYNSYKVIVCPNEIINVVGIGLIEGICCGMCPLIENDNLLEDYGLIEDINFITYDGSVNDLIDKLKFLHSNEHVINKITNNNKYLATNFYKNSVFNKFMEIIDE